MRKIFLSIFLSLITFISFSQTIRLDQVRGLEATLDSLRQNIGTAGNKLETLNTFNDLMSYISSSPIHANSVLVTKGLNGGLFKLIDTANASLLDGLVLPLNSSKAYIRQYNPTEGLNINWFSGTNTRKQIQSAINVASTIGGFVSIPTGDYSIDSTITIPTGVKVVASFKAILRPSTSNIVMFVIHKDASWQGGDIEMGNVVAKAFKIDGADLFSTADHNTYIKDVRIVGNYQSGQEGLYFVADGTASNSHISFVHCEGLKLDKLEKAIHLYQTGANPTYINGNVFSGLIAGCIYGIYYDTQNGEQANANWFDFQVQTVPQTQRVVYCTGSANVFKIEVWDFLSSTNQRAGYPYAFEFTSTTLNNELSCNELSMSNILDRGFKNKIYFKNFSGLPVEALSTYPRSSYADAFIGDLDNVLYLANKKYTVTHNFGNGLASLINNVFSRDPAAYYSSTEQDTAVKFIRIDFNTDMKVPSKAGIIFSNGKIPDAVSCSVISGGVTTVIDSIPTPFNNSPVFYFRNADSAGDVSISAIQTIIFKFYGSGTEEMRINKLFLYAKNTQVNNYLDINGGTVYGDVNISNIGIGSNSGTAYNGVQIDASTFSGGWQRNFGIIHKKTDTNYVSGGYFGVSGAANNGFNYVFISAVDSVLKSSQSPNTQKGLRVYPDGTVSVDDGLKTVSNSTDLKFLNGSTTAARFMGTTSNLVIQKGGTFTDIPSSRLTINSTTQGVLIPRMTKAQRNAISSPAPGLLVIVTGEAGGEYLSWYNSSISGWVKVTSTAD